MSIFVEETDTVEVVIKFVEENGTITIIEAAGEEDNEDDKAFNPTVIKMLFKRPDFATSQRITSASTITDMSGNPNINLMLLQNNLIYFLAKSWDVKDDKGQPVEMSQKNLDKLRVEIARAVVNQLVQKIGQFI
jgi:hypothetical protein